MLDLRTGDQRSLGRARSLRWVDDATIVVHEVGNDMALVDVASGAHHPAAGVNLNPPVRPAEHAGYRLEQLVPTPPYDYLRNTYRVTRIATGATFEFDAYRAVLAPDGMVFLATVSEAATRVPGPPAREFVSMTSNVFRVDPDTRRATFIATAEPSLPNWPFAASATHVVWNDRACAADDAVTRLYDRRSGRLVEVQAPRPPVLPPVGTGFGSTAIEWPGQFTPAGAIVSGTFGGVRLIDPDRLAYVAVLPFEFWDVFWSPDYRYAAVSARLGHGGVC